MTFPLLGARQRNMCLFCLGMFFIHRICGILSRCCSSLSLWLLNFKYWQSMTEPLISFQGQSVLCLLGNPCKISKGENPVILMELCQQGPCLLDLAEQWRQTDGRSFCCCPCRGEWGHGKSSSKRTGALSGFPTQNFRGNFMLHLYFSIAKLKKNI